MTIPLTKLATMGDAAWQARTVAAGRVIHHHLHITREAWQGINRQPANPVAARPSQPVDISAREPICRACSWNTDGFCQHPGCRICPGKQRPLGGIYELIKSPTFKCPAHKHG